MLQAQVIGNLGADAEMKVADGHEFCAFRVGHNESWTDAAGNKQTRTQWIDCVINGRPNVLPYLKQGQQVYLTGSQTMRVYTSARGRCFKAGVTVHVQRIELLGGSSDAVPSRLYDKDGQQIDVTKFYWCDKKKTQLVSRNATVFNVDKNGWITQEQQPEQEQKEVDRSGEDAPIFD